MNDQGVQMCSYCNWEQKLPAEVSALQKHIEEDCLLHPLRAARERIKTLENRLDQILVLANLE